MFVTNWKKIWDLANMREVPVDEGFDEFLKAVQYGITIERIDFDFKAAHEEWEKMSEDEQRAAIEEYSNFARSNYWKLVKLYNNNR